MYELLLYACIGSQIRFALSPRRRDSLIIGGTISRDCSGGSDAVSISSSSDQTSCKTILSKLPKHEIKGKMLRCLEIFPTDKTFRVCVNSITSVWFPIRSSWSSTGISSRYSFLDFSVIYLKCLPNLYFTRTTIHFSAQQNQ